MELIWKVLIYGKGIFQMRCVLVFFGLFFLSLKFIFGLNIDDWFLFLFGSIPKNKGNVGWKKISWIKTVFFHFFFFFIFGSEMNANIINHYYNFINISLIYKIFFFSKYLLSLLLFFCLFMFVFSSFMFVFLF